MDFSYTETQVQIRAAVNHDEVHRRIGELLKAFSGEWLYTELIGIVVDLIGQSLQSDV